MSIPESPPGIENHQARHGNHQQHALEPNKNALMAHQLAIPPLPKLCDSENRPDENAHGSDSKRNKKNSPLPEPRGAVSKAGAPTALNANKEICADGDEGEKGDDLGEETSNHNLVSIVHGLFVVIGRRGSDGTTGSLEDEGDDVCGEEDPGIGHRRDA